MLRSLLKWAVAPALLLAGSSQVLAGDDPRVIADFIQGLREKGYYDVALQYLDQLRQDPSTPAEINQTIEYEEGKTLIEESSRSNDPDFKKSKLELAERKIKTFVAKNPTLPQVTEALVDLADLLFLRAQDEVDMASEVRIGNERESKLIAARGFYANAKDAHDKAFERLNSKLSEFPKVLSTTAPNFRERERIRNATMQAELKKYVDEYYLAETFPAGSKERNELLQKMLPLFDDFRNRYRTQIAGFTARMWQGKCFEEMGKLPEANGIYSELLVNNTDPGLRLLQRQVAFFRIIVTGKRKEYARAADECDEWLRMFPKDRRSYEALGVQLELAKNIIAQLPGYEGAIRDKALRVATDNLTEVVHFVSPFKQEALTLLQKYRPNAALNATDVSKLNYDDALAQAGQAMSTLAYENAIALAKHAIVKAGTTRDAAKMNVARYILARAELMTKKYYEAAVIAEHVARNYPRDAWGSQSAQLAIQALVEAYSTYTLGNRTTDLDRLYDLAKYTAATWPETNEGDAGRQMVGQVALGRGQYAEAIAAFDAVRPASSNWINAQTFCGDAHWKQSLSLREKGNLKEADAEVDKAVEKLNAALKARRDANAADSDVGLINNACDLAIIKLETNKAAEALSLLDPFAKKLAAMTNREPVVNTAYSRVVASILRGHVADGKVDLAVNDMKTLESIGGTANGAAQLYYVLGRLLEDEIESLKKRNDKAGLAKTEQSYRKFLKELVASKSGQTFQSLKWAADNLLKLGSSQEANQVYNTLVETYGKDPAFLKTPNAGELLFLVKLKQVAALRNAKNLADAEKLLNGLIDENKRSLEAQVEKGWLLDAKAEAKKGEWIEVYNHWKGLAMKLANQSPKPPQYFEAWYEAAEAIKKQGDLEKDAKKKQSYTTLAKTTLASVMRLSPSVGGPEMKSKYDALLKQLLK